MESLKQISFQNVADNLPVMVWVSDLDGDAIWCNQQWCRFTGQTLEEALGRGWLTALHPDDAIGIEQMYGIALQNQEAIQAEYRLRREDGEYRWVFDSAVPWLDDQGSYLGYIGSIVDITDRKRIEDDRKQAEAEQARLLQELEAERARFEAVLRQMPEGVLIADAASGNLILANEQANHILQHRFDLNFELQAYDQIVPFHAYHRNGEVYAPEDYPLVRSLQTGEVVVHEEMEIHHANGKRIVIDASSSPILNDQGDITSAVVLIQDITERKQVETALRQSETILKSFFASSPIGMVFFDRNFRYVYANDALAAINGIPLSEHLGRTIREVLPQWAPIVEPIFRQVMDTQLPLLSQEVVGATYPRDFVRHCLVNFFPVCLPDGEVIGLGVTDLDITERRQAEEALRQSEERLRLAMEGAQMGTWDVDLITGKAIWSNYHFTMLGYQPTPTGEASEILWFDRIHPEDRERVAQEWQQSRQERRFYRAEYRVMRADNGHIAWLAALGSFTYDQSGVAVRSIGVLFDISDRKQTEMALLAQEERYRYILKAVDISIWEEDFSEVKAAIDQLKATGVQDFRQYFTDHPEFVQQAVGMVRLQDVNQASLQLFGAQSKAELLNSLQQIFTPETQDVFVEELLAIAAEETRFAAETVVQTLQGELLHVWCSLSFPPPSEPYERVIVSLLDISDRKQAEAALQQNEQRYRCLAESIPQLVWTANVQGILLDVNQRWTTYTGLTLAQVQLQGWEAVVHPEDLAPLTEQWALAQQNGTQYQAEGRMRRVDGVYRWHLHQAIPMKDDQGQVIQWFGTATDIEEQKQLEYQRIHLLQQEQTARESAEKANRIKDEFLAVLSHELRSPLNPILGWARLLQTRKFSEAGTQKALETIERNAKLQTQLIDDLLDVSRILRGKMLLNTSEVNLEYVIDAAIETTRLAAEAKNILVQKAIVGDVGLISGDAGRLQQVMWNLLSNAVKFTPNGGFIEIRLEQVNTHAQIQVRDTGKGITPAFLPHVF
ncbi:MAG: PAS domain S-box protein, partial [Leptolyngbyaceae cyanobacterium bins.59]|nr:PAS domain S-box protein [Leptolyngbyaceae cyanobacterium bins.59]